jgi:hypothetical protein
MVPGPQQIANQFEFAGLDETLAPQAHSGAPRASAASPARIGETKTCPG